MPTNRTPDGLIESVTGPFAVRTGSREAVQATRDAIRTQTPFQTSGALCGVKGNAGYTGRLNPAERAEFQRVANNIVYTVLSYSTPIAYAYRQMNDGSLPPSGVAADRIMWHVVDQKFSPTTSTHQSALRAALAGRRADYGVIWQDEPLTFEML